MGHLMWESGALWSENIGDEKSKKDCLAIYINQFVKAIAGRKSLSSDLVLPTDQV